MYNDDDVLTALLVYAYCNTVATKIGRKRLSNLASGTTIIVNLQILEISFTKCYRHRALSSLRIKNSLASSVAIHCDGLSSILLDV